MMNPDEAQWQPDGDTFTCEITMRCKPDGSYQIESGSFQFDGDRDGAASAFSSLLQYGTEQAEGGSAGTTGS